MDTSTYLNKGLAQAAVTGTAVPAAEPPRLLNTLREVAWKLNISYTTVWRLTRDGEIRTVRIGTKVLVPESELQAYIERALGREAG